MTIDLPKRASGLVTNGLTKEQTLALDYLASEILELSDNAASANDSYDTVRTQDVMDAIKYDSELSNLVLATSS